MIRQQLNKKPPGKFLPLPKLPLIDPGIYEAKIIDWELHRQFDRMKILIHINVDAGTETIKLTYFASVKIDESGVMREPTPTMKLYKLLRNLWPKSSFSEIDLDELANKPCRVTVDTVRQDAQRQKKSTEEQYSTIREILSLDYRYEKPIDPWEEDDDMPC